jgi:hypothetical protein
LSDLPMADQLRKPSAPPAGRSATEEDEAPESAGDADSADDTQAAA